MKPSQQCVIARLGEAALLHASRGRAVFPLVPGDKLPLIGRKHGGKGCHDATTDQATIRRWWTARPDANIGMHCGPSSKIWVLDIDAKNNGEATLAALEHKHGQLPWTIEIATPGGGRHLYWEWDDDRTVPNSTASLGHGLDTRSHGGYVVIPPSIIGNKEYRIISEHGTPIEKAPDWLYDILSTPQAPKQAKPSEHWKCLSSGNIGEGTRNSTITKIAGHLLRRFVDPHLAYLAVHAINETKCVPPMDASEVDKIIESIGRREISRRGKENGRS